MLSHTSRSSTLAARVIVLGVSVALLGCPKRQDTVPTVDGEPLPTRPAFEPQKNAAADEALLQAESNAEAQSKEESVETYLAVRKAYPQSSAGQEALYRVGAIYFELGDYVNARKTFNELLFENPLFPKANEAKRMLGVAALEVGAYRDAYQTLISLAEKAEGAERDELLRQASRAAEGAHLFREALQISIALLDTAQTPEERQASLDRVTELVEGKVKFEHVREVSEGLSPSNPAWPILTFKLARIYYHVRDWTNLQDSLQRFLREAPGHPFAAQAQEMLERSNRRAGMRPRTVGVILPLTGRYKAVSEVVLRGIQLALEGSDLELVVKDSEGDVDLAGRAVEDLVFDSQAAVIIGPMLGDEARRVALVAEDLQVPNISLSLAPEITEIGPHVFRNMLTNDEQARALVEYATGTLGYDKFALLYPNIPYGVELANEFWDRALEKGAEIRGAEGYDHDDTTYTTEVKKLVGRYYLEDREDYEEQVEEIRQSKLDAFRKRKALEKARSQLPPIVDFDAIFIPDIWQRVGLVAPALAVEDIITNACDPKDLERIRKTTGNKDLKTVTLLGSNQWSSPKGLSGLPELIERGQKFVTCSVYVDGFFVDSKRPATQRFVEKFRRVNNRDPGYLDAIGYDTAALVRQVIERQAPQTRVQMRDALAAVKNFPGATGDTTFDEKREARKQLFLLTIEPKGIRELSPSERVGMTN